MQGEKNYNEVATNKFSGTSPTKRPKLNVNASPNHVFYNNSTNEDNLFKSPFLQSEPKNYKDLNENNTTKSMDFDLLKNLTHDYNKKFNPFDDSTLKMMANSSRGIKSKEKGKYKKPSSFKQMDSNVFPDPNQFSVPRRDSNMELFCRMLPQKKTEGFSFPNDQCENNEAQDLSKVRIKDESGSNADNPETEYASELNDDGDPQLGLRSKTNVSLEMKTGNY